MTGRLAASTAQEPVRIERIEAIPLRVPLAKPVIGSTFTIRNRSTIVTRLYASDGSVGECYNGDSDEKLEAIARIVNEEVPQLLEPAGSVAVERVWELLLPMTYDLRRPRGLGLEAMACVDSALWDLVGKRAGQPLSTLWGGYTDRIRVSAIGGYDSDGDVEALAERILGIGYTACKFKIGSYSPEVDAERVRRLRARSGDEFFISVDGNQAYTFREAVRFAELAADLGVAWLEEPCEWTNDRRWLKELRLITGAATCAGQSEITTAGVRDLIEDAAIDVCNFDASMAASIGRVLSSSPITVDRPPAASAATVARAARPASPS